MNTTRPGFSSRSTTGHLTQFPQKDEAQMSDMEAGFSNSEAAKDAPADVHPDVAEPFHPTPGFSNAKAVQVEGQTVTASAASTEPQAESDEEKPAKKAAAAKRTAKKKG